MGTLISDVSLFDSKYTSSGSSEIRFTVVSKVSIERARGLRGRCGQEQQSKSADTRRFLQIQCVTVKNTG